MKKLIHHLLNQKKLGCIEIRVRIFRNRLELSNLLVQEHEKTVEKHLAALLVKLSISFGEGFMCLRTDDNVRR